MLMKNKNQASSSSSDSNDSFALMSQKSLLNKYESHQCMEQNLNFDRVYQYS